MTSFFVPVADYKKKRGFQLQIHAASTRQARQSNNIVTVHQDCYSTPRLLQYTKIVTVHQHCYSTPT